MIPITERTNLFVNEGDYWTIRYGSSSFKLKGSKGLQYLATLLREPGREVHAIDLVSGSLTDAAARQGTKRNSRTADRLDVTGFGDAGDVIDAKAKAAYRRRVTDLMSELEEAEEFNDGERAARARAEIEALEDQLSAAFGLGGRPRKAASAAERARVNVRNSVTSAIRAIEAHGPELAEHLKKAVRTGTFCWYAAEGQRWLTDRADLPDVDSDNSARRTGASRRRTKQKTPGVLSLMIVDDHPMWRQTLRTVLEGSGVGTVVAEAADGEEAVEMAQAARPETVIMDMNLLDTNGVEATRRLLEILPETKVLMLSSSDERDDVLSAVQAGASGYLLKTAEPHEVADAVRRIRKGELVFPPELAKVVLDEFRQRASKAPRAKSRDR